ncbi:thiamine-phosphate kinase [Thermococcus sp.]|uniref:thiamine-phosphate kinase n=1 Tax=Thermococcus sp. TaxID=35749 RepID=UPI00262E608F|nr:thiamine-phosphate kinase [Thermococcus sp.]
MHESEIISIFLKYLGRSGDLPLGDDAGAVRFGDEWLVVTNDMLVRETDVPDVMTPEQVGFKAVTMNVSDVAAMGARPLGFLFSIGLPKGIEVDYLDGIARGLGRGLEFYGVPVLSADTNEAADLIIDGIALGTTNRLLTRSNVKPGDLVCVTGDIGRSLSGLLVWKEKLNVSPRTRKVLYQKFLEPTARVREGMVLKDVANAAIDISDGLSKELNILSKMSGVRIDVHSGALPIYEEVFEVAEALGRDPVELAISSGEEFELLFTIPPDRKDDVGFEFNVIGKAGAGRGVYLDGTPMPARGWNHTV